MGVLQCSSRLAETGEFLICTIDFETEILRCLKFFEGFLNLAKALL